MHRFHRLFGSRLTWALAGVVCLNAAAIAEEFGFPFYLGNSASTVLNSSQVCNAIRFTADRNMMVDQLHLQTSAAGKGTLTLLLCADDGFGNPDMASPLAKGETASALGWLTVDVEPIQVQAGDVYYLVAVPGQESSISVRTLVKSKGDVQTRTGEPDSEAAQLISKDGGNSWPTAASFEDRAQVYGLSNSQTGDVMGQAFTSATVRKFGRTVYQGQQFIFTLDQPRVLQAVTVRVYRDPDTPDAGAVRVHLFDPSTKQVLCSEQLLSPDQLAQGEGAAFTAEFSADQQPTLEPGRSYVIALESTDSPGTGTYRFETAIVAGNDALFSCTFQQDDGFTVSGAWQDGPRHVAGTTSDKSRMDSFFVLQLTSTQQAD